MSLFDDYAATLAGSVMAAGVMINPLAQMSHDVFSHSGEMVAQLSQKLNTGKQVNVNTLVVEQYDVAGAFEFAQDYAEKGVAEGESTIAKYDAQLKGEVSMLGSESLLEDAQ